MSRGFDLAADRDAAVQLPRRKTEAAPVVTETLLDRRTRNNRGEIRWLVRPLPLPGTQILVVGFVAELLSMPGWLSEHIAATGVREAPPRPAEATGAAAAA